MAGLLVLGRVILDEVANNKGGPRISLPTSKISVWVIPTNENLMVARHTRHLLDSRIKGR
jgi:acetate kinase